MTRIRLHLLALILSAVSLLGCQQLLSKAAEFAAEVLPYLTEASEVLDAIDVQAQAHFRANPNPELERRYDTAMSKARLGLSAAARASEGTKELAGADVESGFDQYEKAFREIMAILGPLGVVRPTGDGDALQAGEGDGVLLVPLPRALNYSAGE